jgi:hypothetical protein
MPATAVADQDTEAGEGADGEPAGPTWTIKADGVDHEVFGSEQGDDGVFLDHKAAKHVHELCSAGIHHQGNWQAERARDQQLLQQAQIEVQAANVRSSAVMRRMTELMSLPEDQLYQKIMELRQTWPQIQADAQTQAANVQAQATQQQLASYQADEQARQVEPILVDALAVEVQQYQADERFKTLTDDDLATVYQRLWNERHANNVFVFHQGQWYTNKQVVEEHLEYAARFRGKAVEGETRANEAKADNAAAVGQSGQKPPRQVGKAGSAPAGGKTHRRPDFSKVPLDEQADAADEWFEDQTFED